MVKSFIHTIFLRRHFWRYSTFDEVAELYVSRMLRMAALYLISSFMSIYMYQIGYSVAQIAFLWCGLYMFKAVISLPVARLVAWIGPKHSILISNILYIPVMVGFAMVPQFGIGLLIPTFIVQGISAALYGIAYNVDFSKVKSLEHAGKEIAYMNIFEKVTTGVSPLVGGFIAYLWGPQVAIIAAATLFALAAVPLLRTGEPVRVNQKLTLRGFPWKLLFRHSMGQFGLGFDVFASGTVWTLYVAIAIIGLSTSNNNVYAITGILTSVVLVVAIVASYTYGRLIDRRRGGDLMKISTIANALTHLIRPFVQTPVTVAGLNAANELATTGYMLPYTRAVFDNADLSGVRVTYLGVSESVANFGAGMAALILGLMTLATSEAFALHNFFFIAAGVVLLILTARFPLYKK